MQTFKKINSKKNLHRKRNYTQASLNLNKNGNLYTVNPVSKVLKGHGPEHKRSQDFWLGDPKHKSHVMTSS